MNQQTLIEDNMNLVYFVIHKYYPNLSKDEDIVQIGMLALCKAASTFDESKSKFTTYASHCVINAINSELRNRKKRYNTLSLDYEIMSDDGECVTFGDFIIGEEDVKFVDVDGFINNLTPLEKEIYRLRQDGVSVSDIAKQLNRSFSSIYTIMRRMKLKWREVNGD